MKTSLIAACFLGTLAACGSAAPTPQGLARLAISELSGACPSGTGPVVTENPHTVTAAALLGDGSRFVNGNLFATAWRQPNGTIARLFVDTAPGLLGQSFPLPTPGAAVGLVEWNGQQRRFVGDSVSGNASITFSHLSMHARISGVDETGAALCRFVSLQAEFDTPAPSDIYYDPYWYAADPGIMILDDGDPTPIIDDTTYPPDSPPPVDPGFASDPNATGTPGSSNDPGVSNDPGSSDPGSSDPGSGDPGSNDPGSGDSGGDFGGGDEGG